MTRHLVRRTAKLRLSSTTATRKYLNSTALNPHQMSSMEAERPTRDEGTTQASPVDALPATKTDAGSSKEEPQLPKLSAKDYRTYNSMAEHMEYFHTHFRQTWKTLYSAASAGKRPSNLSLHNYLNIASQFCRHLTAHHTIEEQHIFPVLARKMECFRKELHLLTQHKQIHEGLEKFEEYIDQCKVGERELRLAEVKELMDAFGTVLWSHLDDEVQQLGAENMRKYWSLEEMRRMPM